MLGKVTAQVRILDLGEEFVMVCFGDWSLGRCEVALLGEEAWLSGYVNRGRRSSWRIRSTAGGSTGRGREGEVDGVGKKAVYGFPLVKSYTMVAM